MVGVKDQNQLYILSHTIIKAADNSLWRTILYGPQIQKYDWKKDSQQNSLKTVGRVQMRIKSKTG